MSNKLTLPGLETDDDGSNITNGTLSKFRKEYDDTSITKSDIFEYIYGVLHAPDFKQRYRHELKEEPARVPMTPDFWTFATAGKELMELHLGYETCEEYELTVVKPPATRTLDVADCIQMTREEVENVDWRIHSKMKLIFENPKDTNERIAGVRINKSVGLIGIPETADGYTIAGDHPVHCATKGLTFDAKNKTIDPNDMFEGQPPDAIRHYLQRLVHLAIRSNEIISALPPSLPKAD